MLRDSETIFLKYARFKNFLHISGIFSGCLQSHILVCIIFFSITMNEAMRGVKVMILGKKMLQNTSKY